MINSRDSANTWNPNKKEQIEVPFSVGTIVELKENPSVLAEIIGHRSECIYHSPVKPKVLRKKI